MCFLIRRKSPYTTSYAHLTLSMPVKTNLRWSGLPSMLETIWGDLTSVFPVAPYAGNDQAYPLAQELGNLKPWRLASSLFYSSRLHVKMLMCNPRLFWALYPSLRISWSEVGVEFLGWQETMVNDPSCYSQTLSFPFGQECFFIVLLCRCNNARDQIIM